MQRICSFFCYSGRAAERIATAAGRKNSLAEEIYKLVEVIYNAANGIYSVVNPIYSVVDAIHSVVNPIYSVVEAIYKLVNAIYSVVNPIYSLVDSIYSVVNRIYNAVDWKNRAVNALFTPENRICMILEHDGRAVKTFCEAASPAGVLCKLVVAQFEKSEAKGDFHHRDTERHGDGTEA